MALRNAVWQTYVGPLAQIHCPICRLNVISATQFDASHVVAEAKGGPTTLENLRPLCGTCNKSMGTTDMRAFISFWGFRPDNQVLRF